MNLDSRSVRCGLRYESYQHRLVSRAAMLVLFWSYTTVWVLLTRDLFGLWMTLHTYRRNISKHGSHHLQCAHQVTFALTGENKPQQCDMAVLFLFFYFFFNIQSCQIIQVSILTLFHSSRYGNSTSPLLEMYFPLRTTISRVGLT